ncbi:MAG: amino acid transporter [Rhizobiaceae bacterium]|nr:MAG: amino acid transporter [Rhizobiaceae bacterium]
MTEIIPDEEAWDAWHPAELAQRLAGVDRPWCVVGGWALDLWHGRETREHHDLEFTVLREDFDRFRRVLTGMAFYTVNSGVFEVLREEAEPDPSISQVWCWDIAAARWRVDMMIEPGTPEIWICKRDHAITRPRGEIVGRSVEGVPYLGPSAILLLKAKHQRPKDEADFDMALPLLETSEKAWLKSCLGRLYPEHDWNARL